MSLKSPELSLIIPCYNEELNIPPLMKRLNLIQEEWIEFILVNNGSNDNTRNIIVKEAEKLDLKIKLVDIKKNNGYGYGIMEGIKTGSGSILSWTHADLQTEGQSPEARFMIQEDMCMGHREAKTWTLNKWMEDQGASNMEELNKIWMEIVAKLNQ